MDNLYFLLNSFYLSKKSKVLPLLQRTILNSNMKTKQSLMMLLMIMFWITSALGQSTIPPSCFTDSHDITSLQAWGPYSCLLYTSDAADD